MYFSTNLGEGGKKEGFEMSFKEDLDLLGGHVGSAEAVCVLQNECL